MNEKNSYFRTVNILFAIGLIPLICQFLIQIPYKLLCNAFPEFIEQNPFWTSFFLLNVFYILLYTTLAVLPASFAFKKRPFSYFKSEKISAYDAFSYIVIFLSVSMVFSYVWNKIQLLINAIAGKEVIGDYTQLFTMPQGPFQIVAYFVLVSVLPAICEELLMRSVFCGTISEYNEKAAVVLSALMFAIFHYTFAQSPYAFVVGLLLGAVYVKTRSFLLVASIHFFNNIISAGTLILKNYQDNYIFLSAYGLIIFSIVVCGFVFFVIRVVQHKKGFRKQQLVSGKEAFKYALLSPLLWVNIFLFAAFSIFVNSRLT